MKSSGYIQYLKKQNRIRLSVFICQIVLLVFLLVIWQLAADYGLINTFIASSPKNVFHTITNLYLQHNLCHHIWITTYETCLSFFLGTILGIGIAIVLWYHPFLSKVVDPYLTIFNSLPKVSLGPILIIWVGANTKSIIVMALFISLIVTIISVYNGFMSTDINKIKLMKAFKANKRKMLQFLIMPYNYKTIISSLKINISMSMIGVIMGELLVSKSGIGYLIMYGSQVFNLDLVISGIFILMIVSALLYFLVKYLEKILIKY